MASSAIMSGTHNFTRTWVDFDVTAAGHRFLTSPAGTLTNCIFVNISDPYVSDQYFIRSLAVSLNINNCIFIDVVNSGGRFAQGTTNDYLNIRNSIISCDAGMIVSHDGTAFNIEEYNCWYSENGSINDKPGGAFDATSLDDVDPKFVDAAGKDFRLADDSPCIGTGHA